MRRVFFKSTTEALNGVTAQYDFLWPTAAALWNLRWQVVGYCAVRPEATESELRSRFIEGSGLTGANLRQACVETTWDQQTERLAGVLLTNLFAIYEGWIKRTAAVLALPKAFERSLQSYGVSAALASRAQRSSLIQETVYPVLTRNPRHNLALLDNWLVAYRYFKEIRNKQLHEHGLADATTEEAYLRFSRVATTSDLGVTTVPQHLPVQAGSEVRLSLRGVVGFSDILLRVIVTIDAELACEPKAEHTLVQRWREVRSPDRLFKSNRSDRRRQLSNVFQKLGFGGVEVNDSAEASLKRLGLVSWHTGAAEPL